jgi:AcrR family transcriptional regulator
MRTVNPVRLERIFDSAVCLFAERRFHEVKMDDIAAHAGVSKGALYHHFKDKDALYVEIVLRGMKRLFEDVRERVAAARQAEDKLRGFIQEGIRFFTLHPFYLELIEIADQADSEEVAELRTQFIKLCTGIMRELEASGRWTASDPEFAARALLGMMREVLRWKGRSSSELCQSLERMVLHGLRKA